jgi:hypothetical protein
MDILVGTWDRFFHFPSEGRHAEDFSMYRKNPTALAGFEPANSGTRGQHANHQTTEAIVLWVVNWSVFVFMRLLT